MVAEFVLDYLFLLSIAPAALSVWLFLTIGAKRASFIRMNRNQRQKPRTAEGFSRPSTSR
jgi:hypothetical protein